MIDILSTKSIKNINLNNYDFIINDSTINYNIFKTSVSFPQVEIKEDIFISSVAEEIKSTIFRKLISKLSDNDVYETHYLYIDELNINTYQSQQKLINLIQSIGPGFPYKNIITSSKISNILSDFSQFIPILNNSSQNLYKIGKLYDTNIWVDPFMKWDEKKILLFNNIVFNFDIIDISIHNECAFMPRLLLSFKLGFDIKENSKLVLFTDKNDPEYREYIQNRRNDIIGNII